MINLLPPAEKKQLQAARMNVRLVHYNFLVLLAFVFLVLMLMFVYAHLTNEQRSAENTILANSKREGSYTKIKDDAATFRSELNDAKKVLDSQISYSKTIARLSSLLPEGTAIKERLELSPASFGRPMTIAVVTNPSTANQLLANLSSSPYITNVTRGKITIADNKAYSIEVTLTLKREIAAP